NAAVHFRDVTNTKEFEHITLNSSWLTASAHWTNVDAASEQQRHIIKIFFTQGLDSESTDNSCTSYQYILTAPSVAEKYTIMSNSGQLEEYNECFLNVAF